MTNTQTETGIAILKTLVSYLLARESKLSGHDMTSMHGALSESVLAALEKAGLSEAEIADGVSFLDSTYSLAAVFAAEMQK